MIKVFYPGTLVYPPPRQNFHFSWRYNIWDHRHISPGILCLAAAAAASRQQILTKETYEGGRIVAWKRKANSKVKASDKTVIMWQKKVNSAPHRSHTVTLCVQVGRPGRGWATAAARCPTAAARWRRRGRAATCSPSAWTAAPGASRATTGSAGGCTNSTRPSRWHRGLA